MYVTLKSCPHCKNVVDLNIVSLSSGLGAPVVRCGKCSRPVRTGRKEWESFGGSDQARFFAMSGVYAAAGVVFGHIFGAMAYHVLTNGFVDEGEFNNGGDFWGALIVPVFLMTVQAYRVIDSKRRNAPAEVRSWDDESIPKNMLFGWQCCVQGKMLLLFAAVAAFVCLIGFLVAQVR